LATCAVCTTPPLLWKFLKFCLKPSKGSHMWLHLFHNLHPSLCCLWPLPNMGVSFLHLVQDRCHCKLLLPNSLGITTCQPKGCLAMCRLSKALSSKFSPKWLAPNLSSRAILDPRLCCRSHQGTCLCPLHPNLPSLSLLFRNCPWGPFSWGLLEFWLVVFSRGCPKFTSPMGH
jgi:hypothetical protein